jgi:hypothetical protein
VFFLDVYQAAENGRDLTRVTEKHASGAKAPMILLTIYGTLRLRSGRLKAAP